MTVISVTIAVIIATATTLIVTSYPKLKVPVIGFFSTLYTIPSLALIILLIPFFGLSQQSVIIATIIYSQAILVRSFTSALQTLEPTVLEAAKGMGMNFWQLWGWIKIPLILPLTLAGVRLATTVTVAITAIGAKFGAGGLGTLLFEGVSQSRNDKILAGAISVTLLALTLNTTLVIAEKTSQFHHK